VSDEPRPAGTDLIGEFQRWIFRSGARGMTRGVSGQIRSALGRSQGSGDVWERATTLPQDEAPECAWCPVCRAARRLNESGPGLSGPMAAATDAFATVAQDAMSMFEAAMTAARPVVKDAARPPASGARPPASGARPAAGSSAAGPSAARPGARDEAASPPASPAAGRGVWDEAVSSPAEGSPSEPDDRG
jgi:hypothetical protein